MLYSFSTIDGRLTKISIASLGKNPYFSQCGFKTIASASPMKKYKKAVLHFFILVFIWSVASCSAHKELKTADDFYNKGNSILLGNVYNSYLTQAKAEEAIKYFESAVSKSPDHAEAYIGIGLANYYSDRYSEALTAFNKSLEIDANHHEAYFQRGKVYQKINEIEKAELDFLQNRKINEGDPSSFFRLGVFYSDIQQYKKSIQYYDTTIIMDDSHITAYSNRGFVKMLDHQYLSALNDCNFAIELDPDKKVAYNNRGLIKHSLELFTEAVADFELALECTTTSANKNINLYIYNNTGNTYLQLEDYENACKFWTRAIESGYKYQEKWLDMFGTKDPNEMISQYCQ